jgi:MFS transporter, DHA1 family, inner membrane transport protein
LFVVYGTWMESTFGLSLVALGVSATVIGVAELSGEGLTAFLADRFGLHRAILFGVGVSGVSYVLLILSSHNLFLALSTIFFIFLAVEFTIVSSLSLSTELLPDSRATMLAGYLAAANAGRVVGALIGGPIWLAGGILATSLFAVALSGIGLLCFIWGFAKRTSPEN